MDKLLKAITGMVSVEKAAESCHDCVVGAFCTNHDEEFWDFWREAKRHLTSNSAGIEKVSTESATQPKIDFCEPCGTALGDVE